MASPYYETMTIKPGSRPEPKPELILANWRAELDSADLYRFMASKEREAARATLLRDMAAAEIRHAQVMERGLNDLGIPLPTHRLSFQTRILKTIVRCCGPRLIYPLLHGTEMTAGTDYAAQDASTAALAAEERSHARALGQITQTTTSRTESWHSSGGGGTLRATVFGVNDGLVSNVSLIMGFAGASADAKFVLLAGLSGLLAGATSMAAGEYVSVKAQRELYERQIELEAAELSVTPEEEIGELAAIYEAKGLTTEEAEAVARRLTADPAVALDTLVREELGLDPNQLGSPLAAAVSSFLAFAVGAFLPVVPYFFGASAVLVALSLVLTGVALFSVGAIISIFTGKSITFSGGRQLVIGGVAATVTFGLGSLIGVATGV